MSCCGNSRGRVWGGGGGKARRRSANGASLQRPAPAVYVQYQGPTRLTAVGPGTGRRYVFARPGAIQRVDPRDHRALLKVPRLRLVRRP